MAVLDRDLLTQAQKAGKLVEHKDELRYQRFREDFHHIPRGTVLLPDRVLFGFPHIPRIFTLKKGIARNIRGSFYVEEKIDGFNLRIASVDGRLFAFSRGGFLDAFATEKVRELHALERFFEAYPAYVLCAEMIGNTPYTRPTSRFDVRIFIFDIDPSDGKYLPCEQKYRLLKKYAVPSVPVLGKFSAAAPVETLARKLLRSGKEGMVIKSADRSRIVKMVTPAADIEDIRRAIATLFDMPTGFFLQRVLRSAIFMKDFRLPRSKYGKRLGSAFYEGLLAGLLQLEREGELREEFEILIRDKKIWEAILRHTSREVKIEKMGERAEGKRVRIRFKKVYKRSSKLIRDFMRGKALVD